MEAYTLFIIWKKLTALKRPHYPKQSIDSVQLLLKKAMVYFTDLENILQTYIWK